MSKIKEADRAAERADDGDEALLTRARDGDAFALEALLERHQRRVYGFGMKMCRDPEDAQDVLQDTLLAAARTVRDFRGASSLSTWLYTIARSFCIKRRRRSKFAAQPDASLDDAVPGREARQVPDPATPADESLAGRQVRAALDEAIARLDPRYREVLVLRDVEGLSASEVAEVMGLSVEAVKSRLHRARLAVREAVAPLLGGEPPSTSASTVTSTRADHGKTDPSEAPGSACPDVLLRFSQHLEGEISSALCAELDGHVGGCPSCRARCDSLQRTLAVCKSAAPDVPAAVQASVRQALRRFVELQQG